MAARIAFVPLSSLKLAAWNKWLELILAYLKKITNNENTGVLETTNNKPLTFCINTHLQKSNLNAKQNTD